ncbi:MAG: NepR family anti-sigma factor [Sphingomonas sp.]
MLRVWAATGVLVLRPTDQSTKKSSASSRPTRNRDGGATGAALRTVYQRTVEEAVPAEMLDLLNKLS